VREVQLLRRVEQLGVPRARVVKGGAVAACVLAGALWWQWPALTGAADKLDVGIVTDGLVQHVEQPVSRRIREDGHTVAWFDSATTWCDAPAAVDTAVAAGAGTIVVSFAADDGCADTAVSAVQRAAQGRRLIVVLQPGGSGVEAAFARAGVTVVDPTRLIGAAGQAASLGCQWWDICPPNGFIAVRDADGSLTLDGGERVARMLVAVLR